MKWLFSFAGWCLLLLAVSIWRLGWENHVLWAIRVFPALSQGVPYFANKSLSALIYELYLGRVPLELDFSIPVVLSRLVSLLNLGIFCGTLYYFWRRNRRKHGQTACLKTCGVTRSFRPWRLTRTGTCASSSSARRSFSTKRPDTFSQTVLVTPILLAVLLRTTHVTLIDDQSALQAAGSAIRAPLDSDLLASTIKVLPKRPVPLRNEILTNPALFNAIRIPR